MAPSPEFIVSVLRQFSTLVATQHVFLLASLAHEIIDKYHCTGAMFQMLCQNSIILMEDLWLALRCGHLSARRETPRL